MPCKFQLVCRYVVTKRPLRMVMLYWFCSKRALGSAMRESLSNHGGNQLQPPESSHLARCIVVLVA